MTPKEKKEKIANYIAKILETLDLDLTSPSLRKTPERVANMYVDEVFSGLNSTTFPEITLQHMNKSCEMILIKDIDITSFCEHHLVPMVGKADIAYLPKKGVLGLSTIHRIIRYFAKRPQLQERLTEEIATSLQKHLETNDVAVLIEMQHFCVIARGVEDQSSTTQTSITRGSFLTNAQTRSELFALIAKKNGRERKPDSVLSL